MGKYCSGIGLADMMRAEMKEVEAALDRTNITEEDRTVVTDALKEAFYQLASSNAAACISEEFLEEYEGAKYPIVAKKLVEKTIREHMARTTEMYPEEWIAEAEEDEDGD